MFSINASAGRAAAKMGSQAQEKAMAALNLKN